MKLLFDQKLSYRLCAMLADIFPGSAQVHRAVLDQAADDVIWAFAARENFTVVTLDADFADISRIARQPVSNSIDAPYSVVQAQLAMRQPAFSLVSAKVKMPFSVVGLPLTL